MVDVRSVALSSSGSWVLSSPPDATSRVVLSNSSVSASQLISVCPQCPSSGADASVSAVRFTSADEERIELRASSPFDFSAQSIAAATLTFDTCLATPNAVGALPASVITTPGACGCSSAPCLNGGVCTPTGARAFSCDCARYWSGATCSAWIDPCSVQQCYFGATCVSAPLATSYSCVCNATSCGAGPAATTSSGVSIRGESGGALVSFGLVLFRLLAC